MSFIDISWKNTFGFWFLSAALVEYLVSDRASKMSSCVFFSFVLCCCVCREIRNVELLKLRFGESHMHYCEVMLKVNALMFQHEK